MGDVPLVGLERVDRQPLDEARRLRLYREVNRFAAALKAQGVGRGDRVLIYMPMIAEAAFAMLACARIGAIHSVVFAGFGAKALSDRIQASGSRLVFTSDVTYRRGKNIRLKEIVDEALQTGGESVEHVIVLRRTGEICATAIISRPAGAINRQRLSRCRAVGVGPVG